VKLSDIRHIHIDDYSYSLPDGRIAKYPLVKRDDSKLLVYKDQRIKEDIFSSLADYIPENSLMVFNNTKVIQARMRFRKLSGAQIEIFCLEPYDPSDYSLIFQQTEKCSWTCLIGNLKKWKEDSITRILETGHGKLTLTAKKIKQNNDSHIICFEWDDPSVTFADLLEIAGELPIPPYLNRKTEEKDKETYQTVYSKIMGSVAAPTAGLHFTPEVFEELKKKEIKTDEVTLHVGAGTFRPVKTEEIGDHSMHTEFISVRKQVITDLYNNKDKVIAVGTTSVRTLESLYYIGCLLKDNMNIELSVPQWMPYTDAYKAISVKESLETILGYLEKNKSDSLYADTRIMIAPGYKYKVVDAMITNFHQPQSTLLLLVSAFVGDNWRSIYDYALRNNFRFLSYGDSSLLFRENF